MKKTNVIELNRQAKTFEDPLTDIIRNGARKILMEALETEIELFLEQFTDLKTEDGKQRVIRNGYLPERKIVTGIGEVDVKVPRIRDQMRKTVAEPIQYASSILPP